MPNTVLRLMRFLFSVTYIWLMFSIGSLAMAARHEPRDVTLQSVRVGVLALRGSSQAMDSWQATAVYLQEKIPGYRFSIVPLAFDEIETYVAENRLDFVIANPAQYVALAERYGVSPIATLINRLDEYDASLYGGVIFRRSSEVGQANLEWLKGKRFMAVAPMSLGGFLAARLEFSKHGIDPYRDFAAVDFVGTHDAVVQGVIAGQANAGTTRTDVLERMAAEGKIDLTQIEVISPYKNGSDNNASRFPYLRSTRLYPEWPFSKLAGVPDRLARQVSIALLAMPAESRAALDAEIVGWNVPMTYIPVVDLLRELELPPFESEPVTIGLFVRKEPLAAFLAVGGIVVTSSLAGILWWLNRRLRRARVSLIEANQDLEARVRQRTAALECSEREMENLATHDALTGILNRRALEARMLEEVNRVNRYGHPLSVLMLDIDFFKKVNDSFGHIAGDQVLKGLAQWLVGALRNTDLVARYGGEEFVIVLPMTPRQEATQLAERLCDGAAERGIDLGSGHVIHITVSVGVASIEETGSARWDSLIDAADRAMYQAKESGRNRVCVH